MVRTYYIDFLCLKKIWGTPSNNRVKEDVNSSTNGKAKKVTIVVKKTVDPKKVIKLVPLTSQRTTRNSLL